MKAWSQLPNAHHIDWIIESVKENPKVWREARLAEWAPARHAALTAARTVAATAGGWVSARKAYAAADEAIAALATTWDAEAAARAVLLALVIYDDCDQYINMGYEKLLVYAKLSEKPQAILLLPMVYVREKLNESMVTVT